MLRYENLSLDSTDHILNQILSLTYSPEVFDFISFVIHISVHISPPPPTLSQTLQHAFFAMSTLKTIFFFIPGSEIPDAEAEKLMRPLDVIKYIATREGLALQGA